MRRILALLMALTLVIFIVGCANGTNGEDASGPADEDAPTLIARSCTGCHGDSQIYTNRDRDEWPDIVNKMAVNTFLNQEEIETIILYLQDNYSN